MTTSTTTTPASGTLDPAAVRRSLAVRDLTDPAEGPHAVGLIVEELEHALGSAYSIPVRRHRANPVVPVADNYDRLGYPSGAVTRDARYTRYLRPDVMLRSHTTAMIPQALEELAADPVPDVALSCPGITYRRDAIDRHHVGEPHQIDLWRVRTAGARLGVRDLVDLIERLVAAALPGHRWRTVPTAHAYTTAGRQIDVRSGDRWVEVGECGLAHPRVLADAGLGPGASGLALGLGLDRLVMLRKGVDDIRLLRSADPRVAEQMRDLDPYRPVARTPAITRDLSVAVDAGADGEVLGGRLREALGADADLVEEVAVLSETPVADLPEAARQRLGARDGQRNVLLRVRLRALDRTLTAEEANRLRDRVLETLHQGARRPWAGETP